MARLVHVCYNLRSCSTCRGGEESLFTLHKLVKRRGVTLFAVAALLMVSLSGCGHLTSVEPQAATGNYAVALTLDPVTLNPPQTGTITFSVTDKAKDKPVTAFEPVS